MATTYLNVVNNVQKRLREQATASVTSDDYSTLLGILVNDAKRKIEDSYPWSEYRTTVSVSIAADATSVVLTGTTFRSKVLWAYNDTKSFYMKAGNSELALWNANSSSGTVTNDVTQYSPGGWSNDGEITLLLYPKASGATDLLFGVYTAPVDYSADADVVRIPPHVLELGAMILAVSERGEDGGALFDEVNLEYKRAIAYMMNAEQAHRPQDFDWSNPEIWRNH